MGQTETNGQGNPLSRCAALDGEHARVVISDIARRPRPDCPVIVIANEKGGVGKSTIAFHLCVALSTVGLKVAAIDLDRRQQSLERALINRSGTARRLGIDLPTPLSQVLIHQSAATLCHEMTRLGSGCDIIILDVAGQDSPIARRAIAMADTLVTPVNSSFVDLSLLGRFHPVTHDYLGPGCFAALVNDLRDERTAQHLPPLDWVVVPNRLRSTGSRNEALVKTALDNLQGEANFRLSDGISERVAFRELFQLGLTHLDLKRIQEFSKVHSKARVEMLRLVEYILQKPDTSIPAIPKKSARAHISATKLEALTIHS